MFIDENPMYGLRTHQEMSTEPIISTLVTSASNHISRGISFLSTRKEATHQVDRHPSYDTPPFPQARNRFLEMSFAGPPQENPIIKYLTLTHTGPFSWGV